MFFTAKLQPLLILGKFNFFRENPSIVSKNPKFRTCRETLLNQSPSSANCFCLVEKIPQSEQSDIWTLSIGKQL